MPESPLATATLLPGPDAQGWVGLALTLSPTGDTYLLERRGEQARVLLHDQAGHLKSTSAPWTLGEAMMSGPIAMGCTADGSLLVGVAGGVDLMSADLKSAKPALRVPPTLADVFAPIGVWSTGGADFLVADASACTVWLATVGAATAWPMGARGRSLGQFMGPIDLCGGSPGTDRGYMIDRDGDATHVVVLDSHGVVHTQLDGAVADRVRAGPNGEVYIYDATAKTLTQYTDLDTPSALDPGAPREAYAKLPELLAKGDKTAVTEWVRKWDTLHVTATVRLAAFRMLARAGFQDEADKELESALTELPGRYDALLEALRWAQATKRPALASDTIKRFGWTISDAGQYRQLTLLEQEIREQAGLPPAPPAPRPSPRGHVGGPPGHGASPEAHHAPERKERTLLPPLVPTPDGVERPISTPPPGRPRPDGSSQPVSAASPAPMASSVPEASPSPAASSGGPLPASPAPAASPAR